MSVLDWRHGIHCRPAQVTVQKFYFLTTKSADSSSHQRIWIGAAIGTSVVLMVVCNLCYLLRRRKLSLFEDRVTKRESDQAMQPNEVRSAKNMELGRQKDHDLPVFSFSAIKTATDDFADSNKLGEGGYGPVIKQDFSSLLLHHFQKVIFLIYVLVCEDLLHYSPSMCVWKLQRKLLQEGQEIAVKRLSKISRQGLEEFKNKVSLICVGAYRLLKPDGLSFLWLLQHLERSWRHGQTKDEGIQTIVGHELIN